MRTSESISVRLVSISAVILWLLASNSLADTVIGSIDWDSGAESGWTSHYNRVVMQNTSGTSTWMNVVFTNSPDNPGPYRWDIVKVPATNLFTGTWDTGQWFQVDFWASNIAPLAVQIKWKSSTNEFIWGAALTPTSVGEWTTLSASLLDWNDWQYPGATEGQYLSDLTGIDWIGIYIFRNTGAEQLFGIDNLQLWIPEPAELLIIAAILIATAMELRKKRRKQELAT